MPPTSAEREEFLWQTLVWSPAPHNVGELREHRVGLARARRSDEKEFFNGLNEAVVEELAIRFTLNTEGDEIFRGEKEETERLKALYPRYKTLGAEVLAMAEYKGKIAAVGLSYPQERRILTTLIDGIYTHNRDKFSDREEVFEVFDRAAATGYTGSIKDSGSMKELVEQAFGRGTLAELARFEGDVDSQERLINILSVEGGSIEAVKNAAKEIKDEQREGQERRTKIMQERAQAIQRNNEHGGEISDVPSEN